jgi:hypothetical protein
MIVEHGTRHLLGQHAPQLRNVWRGATSDAHHDKPRYRQLIERKAAAEPRLEQSGRLLFGIRPHFADTRKGARDRSRLRDRRVRVTALRWDNLDGYLARHIGLPFACGRAHQDRRAGRQRS